MLDLTKIQSRLGHNIRLIPGPSDRTPVKHRHKASTIVQTKDGREYYILLQVWYRFRWAPLTPCYIVCTNGPDGMLVWDHEIW